MATKGRDLTLPLGTDKPQILARTWVSPSD